MKTMHLLPFAIILFTACSNLQQTAQVRDGVYDKPSREPIASTAPVQEETATTDDYYDPDQATRSDRDYYDMAYNDPHYYNYGRFSFGVGVGYYAGSPCGGSYMGMNSTWGSPYGYGDPYGGYGYGSPYGGYGYGYGYPYGGYGSPCGGYYGWNDPWNSGYYNGYGYYGYGGNCYGCYQPIVYCGGPPVLIGHRPTMGGSTGDGGGDGSGNTMNPPTYSSRSLVSLRPVAWNTMHPELSGWGRPDQGTLYELSRPAQTPAISTTKPERTRDQGHSIWDFGAGGGGGSDSQPSRGSFGGDGGGSRPANGGGRPR